ATRFTLAAMASPGTDIAFNEARTEGYRAFANKIWNAARFIFMNVQRAEEAGAWSNPDFRIVIMRLYEEEQERHSRQKNSEGWRGLHQLPKTGSKVDVATPFEDRWINSKLDTL